MPLLKVQDIGADYGGTPVIQSLSFDVQRGEIVSLLGSSGCGKTTALRAIAGFEPLQAGAILIDQQHVSLPGMTVPPEQRSIGMVFQDYALFPHLTARDNITFGLRKKPRAERQAQVDRLLDATGLEESGRTLPARAIRRSATACRLGPRAGT